MKITNKYNLPEAFLNAMKHHRVIKEKEIHITDLINPPLIYHLKLKHQEEIEEDISERLWALLGIAIHSLLEKHAPDYCLSEEEVVVEHKGWKIIGRVDLYNDNEKAIEDYKVTSVYSFLLSEKKEWEAQLNCYAWLYEKINFKVEKLFINAILRDWVKVKTKDVDYPEIPFIRKEIPLWSFEERERFINERLEKFSDEPEPCNDEERWVRGGDIALMEKGKKYAIKVFKNEEAIKDLLINKNQYLERRPKRYIRCEEYCIVRNFCKWRKNEG